MAASQVEYSKIKEIRTAPRAFGLWGDMVRRAGLGAALAACQPHTWCVGPQGRSPCMWRTHLAGAGCTGRMPLAGSPAGARLGAVEHLAPRPLIPALLCLLRGRSSSSRTAAGWSSPGWSGSRRSGITFMGTWCCKMLQTDHDELSFEG